MTITRVTQRMMSDRSLLSLQTGLNRLAKVQEQLTTGRVLNRPSDSPTDTTSAMRLRASIADTAQYSRNATDGLGWLGQIDATLRTMVDQVRRSRDLGMAAVNAANQGPESREALAAEVDQLRDSLISNANATFLGRPLFGGLVSGSTAYDASGAFVGVSGSVSRTVAQGVKVDVNLNGPDVFGPDGASLFDNLTDLAAGIRAGDTAAVAVQLDNLEAVQARMTSAQSDVGTRYNRVDRAAQAAENAKLELATALSNIENVDIARATMDLKLGEVAYQAALASTARLVQPSLSDFLR